MIFELKQKEDKKLQTVYEKAMKELSEFYGFTFERNKPRVFIVNSRKDIDALQEKKTWKWVVGWVENRNILVLNKNKFKTESSHDKISDKEFARLIKHELSHFYYKVIAKQAYPTWLWEGVAIYTSEQTGRGKVPEKFQQFLKFFDKHVDGKQTVY